MSLAEQDRPKPRKAGRRQSWKKNPAATREDILRVATEEFAANGLAGARVDAIARRTRTSKRMIYYYYGGKEGLYAAVLEKAYADIRATESELELEKLEPVEALQQLIRSTFDYDETHPEFIRLVSIENIHQARHVSGVRSIRATNMRAIDTIVDILRRGREQRLFREDIDPIDVHMMISAFCFFRVSNRYTFGAIFGRDLSEAAMRERHLKMICDAIIGHVLREPAPAAGS